LGYNIAGRFCSCWTCGYISLWDVLLTTVGVEEREIKELISKLPREKMTFSKKHTGKLQVPTGIEGLSVLHCDYLRQRGFRPSQIVDLWGIGGIRQHARLGWRLYIPITYQQELVSWTTRSIGSHSVRYLTAQDHESSISPRDLLYGIDHCTTGSVIIVEGPLDVWAFGYGVVGLLNKRASSAQLEQLSRFSNRTIVLDNETEAQAKARELAADLAVFDGTTKVVCLTTGKDPASADRKELEALKETYL
jgi:hypothetical protein